MSNSSKLQPGKNTTPFSRFEWMLAGRYLRSRRKDTFISVIAGLTLTGVAIGVATLIVVMSVMNGFRAELLSKILGLNGHFSAIAIETEFTDFEELVVKIENIDGVETAIAFVEGQALATGSAAAGGNSSGVRVRGMDFATIAKLPLLSQSVHFGGWDQWDQSNGVAIGIGLARQLGVTIGDTLTLINPDGSKTPFGTTPQIRSYPVNVIFNLGMVEFDSLFVFMPLEPAQRYFKMFEDVLRPGIGPIAIDASDEEIDAAYERITRVSAIEIFITNPDDTDAMREKLYLEIERPLLLTDWKQRNATFFSALQVERVVMFVILSMIVVVAAFNIISSLVMLVKDKAADIAILRTMGATRGSIMRVFFITGAAIGFLGTLLGAIVGFVLALNAETIRVWLSDIFGIVIFPPEIFFLSALPTRIDPYEVGLVIGLSLLLTFLATLYPALRAARYDPVEALRYE
ncbi:Lipoprotein releasing system transmembrane protein LolC/LolE [hydrothermal vent metagenome]|uniref:Lipoprotein releasing system transmembrane protein LolC/LolE n=1 Tax=hydrothermal vent metagenome TaxID=652676 RepID=A0A3B0UB86_9ZZZZ